MGDTTISWLFRPGTKPRSWNPTQGCEMVSPGCKNCYAMRMAARFARSGWSQGLIDLKTGKWSRAGRLAAYKLAEPLSWRAPCTVFVNSMSDLFWERFTNEEIAAVFGVMGACPQHVFIIATKRARRMRDWFRWVNPCGRELLKQIPIPPPPRRRIQDAALTALEGIVDGIPALRGECRWPLPNVWLLVSVENQEMAEARVPDLQETPAVIRGLSCEPLLSPLNLTLHGSLVPYWDIDWVITGCESGPGARPAETAWFRSLRDQCKEAQTPFFFKQGNVKMDGITALPGDIGAGGVAEPAMLDGYYHQEFPG